MDEVEKYIVDGYLFVSRSDYERAKKEYEKIEGLRDRINPHDIDGLMRVYDKLVSKNYFNTPVGIGFLHELREYILENNKEVTLREIPVPKLFAPNSTLKYVEHSVKSKLKDENERLIVVRNRLIIAVVALVVLIIGMFYIVASDDKSSYFKTEEKVIDQYSQWQEQLENWEEDLREREDALENKKNN